MSARLRDQLVEALRRHMAGGKARPPEAGTLMWNLFMEIAAGRTWHANGPNPLGHAEIEAFVRMRRWPLGARHLDLIRALDDAWLEHFFATMEQARGKTTIPRAARQPISTASFDAVFG